MKRTFIKDLETGQAVDAAYVLRRKTMRLTKKDKPYLVIDLADRSGTIEGRVWDNAESVNRALSVGDVARVKGSVEDYMGTKQLKVIHIGRAEDGTYVLEDLIRVFEGRDEALRDVKKMLALIGNDWMKALAGVFLRDEDLLEKLRKGVGAKRWHNAYIGGLIEHTREVMIVCATVCDLYPEADRDITMMGAFMHDLGKIYELDPDKMEYTIEGGLIGHIAIGLKMLSDKISGIEDFPRELSTRLEHMILSHHGEYEQQSPVLPKTLEATIVYHADDLVSQANAIKEIVRAQRTEEKDWSDFVSIKNRKYFIRSPESEAWKATDARTRPEERDDLFDM